MTVSQSTYALVDTEDELKPYLGIARNDNTKDDAINQVNNWVSTTIEGYLDRHLVTRGTLTEYFTLENITSELLPRQWPLLTVTSIHEDTNRSYGSTTLLTVNDDYIVHLNEGRITRVYSSGSGRRSWIRGYRAIKLIYTAGYATTADVPEDVKFHTLKFAALVWREVQRKDQGTSSVSDDLGSVTRLFPAGLTPGIRRGLFAEKRSHFSFPQGEVDT